MKIEESSALGPNALMTGKCQSSVKETCLACFHREIDQGKLGKLSKVCRM